MGKRSDDLWRDYRAEFRLRPSFRAAGWFTLLFLVLFAIGWGLDEAGLLPQSMHEKVPRNPAFSLRFLMH